MRSARPRILSTLAGLGAISALALAGCSAAATSGAGGTWSETGDGGPELTLAEDGTFHGTDGCNQLNGQWSQDGTEVTFEGVASTMMLCVDVPGWPSLAGGEIEGTSMTLLDADGAELTILTRE